MAIKKFTPRKAGSIVDSVHFVCGVLAAVSAGFAVTDPERYKVCFPPVFFFAAAINFCTAWYYSLMPRGTRKKTKEVAYLVSGILLLIVFIISAISLWGN